ncbi:hypothetical protein NUH88_00330 [Nisaea acidiphila]|uniref:Uncharacterized protein n=1 Tax=Nisaea acidiphila TaxID=1862145 RepID=A0A9J7AV19_9PROT|nr:hypothetical protein [Nisaea acidiphila]UUX50156.1 hypothetical protein NUH88_00330 [Nisaea acidiphila]
MREPIPASANEIREVFVDGDAFPAKTGPPECVHAPSNSLLDPQRFYHLRDGMFRMREAREFLSDVVIISDIGEMPAGMVQNREVVVESVCRLLFFQRNPEIAEFLGMTLFEGGSPRGDGPDEYRVPSLKLQVIEAQMEMSELQADDIDVFARQRFLDRRSPGNFIDIGNDHQIVVLQVLQAEGYGPALRILPSPWLQAGRELLDTNIPDPVEPGREALPVFGKMKRFRQTGMGLGGFNEDERIDHILEFPKTQFQDVEFIVEHEAVVYGHAHAHLNRSDIPDFLVGQSYAVVQC